MAQQKTTRLLGYSTVHSAAYGLLFILLFGVGSICGMLLMSALIALPFALMAGRFQRINEAVRIAAGVVSILLGGSMMLEIGQGFLASL